MNAPAPSSVVPSPAGSPMHTRLLILFASCWLFASGAHAQTKTLDVGRIVALDTTRGILRNSISNLHAEGNALWVGPYLNLTTDEGRTWRVPDADSLVGSVRTVYSLDVEGDVIWAGLGYSAPAPGGGDPIPSAGGFLFSTDGGQTFTYRLPPLDAPDDTVEVYGRSRLSALPIIVEESSPPYDIDYDPHTGTVWTAGWASGLRRSNDGGLTWQRVVLPPDVLTSITPDSVYDFVLAPKRPSPTDPGSENHKGFSVLVDETGTVWAGTAGGLNRSTDGGVSWDRFVADGTPFSLTGNWVVSIEEQPLPGRNPVWIASWSTGTGERYGVTVTRDGGETFEQHLVGEEVIDFAFRGETVYVAARRSGLFISDDGGITWRTVRTFRDNGQQDRVVRPNVDVISVATTNDALWVGTDDGLLRSTDEGRTWTIFRAEVPLHPETPSPAVPDVETYAYPNPFSPPSDRFVRIRYELANHAAVNVRIFDFGMNLVRRLDASAQRPGEREITWDGTDDNGLRVANGTYFYAVESNDGTVWGKILVIE